MKNIIQKIPWRDDYDKLAIYNTEVSRGIMHNKIYKARMEKIQKQYTKSLTSMFNSQTKKGETNV